ncbi:MAG: hypothetical protein MUP13_01385 [Thermoanaerobaculales bacterium]|nr:hypothetical protein [Thermoanaerobaculales bacterium]
MEFNLARWKLGKGPAWWHGLEDTGVAPTLTAWTLTNHRNYVRLNWPAAGYTNVYLVVWHKGSGPGFAPTPANAIDAQTWMSIRDGLIVDRPTTPGTHYYRLKLFNHNGLEFLQPDTETAVVT